MQGKMGQKMAHKMQGKMGTINVNNDGVPFVCYPLMAQKMQDKMSSKMKKTSKKKTKRKRKVSGKK